MMAKVKKGKGKPSKAPDEYVDRPLLIQRRIRRGTLDPEKGREMLGGKPIDEWDLDELARGRPRGSDGTFKGHKPTWVTPQLQEEAYNRFRDFVKGELASGSLRALARVKDLVDDAESDRVRLDASKFILEYLIGKPTQQIKADVALQLQGLLAGVLANPDGSIMGVLGQSDEEEEEFLDELDLDE